MKKIVAHNPINFNHSLNRGLVGAWIGPWQQPKGTLVADGCRESNGRLTDMDATTDWVRGPVRGMRALDFDGTNDRVLIPAFSRHGVLTNFTIWMWVNPTTIVASPRLLSRFVGSDNRTEYFLTGNGPSPQRLIMDGATTISVQSSTNVSEGVWSCIAVTRRGSSFAFYLNGLPDGTASDVDVVTGAVGQPWSIGARADAGSPLTAQISEVRIYNRALSAAEIYQLYRLTQREQSDLYNYQPTVPNFA